ncbi:hypothetical protein KKD62_02170 [Patescibacteria group bacterium]|nr:hypothetical protein [Patescibacteria group bacterium]MBU1931675.1 hypothetical protein [Patescibacteria group bacterium]
MKTQTRIIELAKELKIKPRRLVNFLLVSLGKSVAKGQILAQKKTMGFITKTVRAPEAGTVDKIEATTGRLFLTRASKKTGFGFGWGKAKAVLVKAKAELSLKNLNPDWRDKIIWAEAISEPGAIFKAEVLGIEGLILPIETREELQDSCQELVEASELAVVFVKPGVSEKLKQLVGKQVMIDGQKGSVSEA